jgi:hypothetical protein
MRESRTFGSVGGEGGNVLVYPAISSRPHRSSTTGELTLRVEANADKMAEQFRQGLPVRQRQRRG